VCKALVGGTATVSEESEKQIREPGAPYAATAETAVEEHVLERVQFPPYFDRFLDERDRRVASELGRLEAAIEHNGAEISRSLMEMGHRFAEAKGERKTLRAEMERRFAEAKGERKTLRVEMQALRAEMHAQFRWTIGLLFPLVAGMLAIIIRVFFVGSF
jgi:hypothetical protein